MHLVHQPTAMVVVDFAGDKMSYINHAMVALLAKAEASYRIHQRNERICDWLNSGITPFLNKINCSPDRGITKEMLFTLWGGTFIEKSENLLFTGLELVIANFVE